jgi:hypothetical protein
LAGSVSCGMLAQASIQCPLEGLGRIVLSTALPRTRTAAPANRENRLVNSILMANCSTDEVVIESLGKQKLLY